MPPRIEFGTKVSHFVVLAVLGLLLGLVGENDAAAQLEAVVVPDRLAAHSSRNLYLRCQPRRAVDGWLVVLPEDWRLEDVTAIALDRLSELSLQVRPGGTPGTYIVETKQSITTPYELVVGVSVGGRLNAQSWRVVPVVNERVGNQFRRNELTDLGLERVTIVEPGVATNRNGAGSVSRDSEPLVLANGTETITPGASFSVEFWLRTRQRNGLLLSTWNANPNRAYPLEIELDVRGRLTWYWGRPGWHQSLASHFPVADGAWRHIALVHNAERRSYRMFVDGGLVDSLYADNVSSSVRFLPTTLAGRPEGDSNGGFEGWIDELRIWNRARTPSEIRNSMKIPLRQAEGLRFVDGYDVTTERNTGGRRLEIESSDLMLLNPVGDFRAGMENGVVNLEWSIAGPQEQRMVVERSSDAMNFTEVGRFQIEPRRSEQDLLLESFTLDDPLSSSEQAVWFYRIRQSYPDGAEQVSGIVKVGTADADLTSVLLIGNSPNPFNNATLASFEVREQQEVSLSVWSIGGNLVDVLADRVFDIGLHQIRFAADDLPSGIYFLLLRTPRGVQTVKMTLMK